MRYDAGMRIGILIVLVLALAACTIGRASSGARSSDPRSPYIFHGEGEDAAIDVINGASHAAWIAATQKYEPDAPLCTPNNESGDPPHTCPAKTGEQQTPEQSR
jgi:hypothetical protein